MLEGLSRLGPGEHYWVQFITVPVGDFDEPEWRQDGQKIVNKIVIMSTKTDALSEVFEGLGESRGGGSSQKAYKKFTVLKSNSQNIGS